MNSITVHYGDDLLVANAIASIILTSLSTPPLNEPIPALPDSGCTAMAEDEHFAVRVVMWYNVATDRTTLRIDTVRKS